MTEHSAPDDSATLLVQGALSQLEPEQSLGTTPVPNVYAAHCLVQHVLPALKSSFVQASYAQSGVPKALIELVPHVLLPPLTVLPSAHDIGLTQQMPPSVNSESTQPEPAHSVAPELSRVVEQRRERREERKKRREEKRKLDIFN